MAHFRKPLAIALAANTGVLAVEMIGGVEANSLSLLTDGVHNLSDETALGFLLLAYTLRRGLSSHFLRSANLFNSVGLFLISGLLVWQAIERLIHPQPVLGLIPIVIGLLAAAGNWGVAKALQKPSKQDVAIRLAYVHNLGDVLVSLAPVVAGIATVSTGSFLVDPFIALIIAAVIVVTTLQAIRGSHQELLWPKNVVCGHEVDVESKR
jgi:cobalt-zinc-cadmium efflux system protein